jgi:DNA-binding MarR family transcriptional regulator
MAETRWLDPEETIIWRRFIEASSRVTQLLDASLKETAQMTLDDYEVLVHLSEAPDQQLRMTDLSHRLLHSQARVSQRVDRLVKRNWVARQKCPEDGRVTYATITEEGMAAITATAPHHVEDVRALLIDLIEPEDRPTMARVLDRIAANARQQQ